MRAPGEARCYFTILSPAFKDGASMIPTRLAQDQPFCLEPFRRFHPAIILPVVVEIIKERKSGRAQRAAFLR
jgi:hypothetical protein